LVRRNQFLILLFLFFIGTNNSFSIESAAHEAEIAKCIGILMTIKNNNYDQNLKLKSKDIMHHYFKKITSINHNSMTKEMSEKGAKLVQSLEKKEHYDKVLNIINSCVMTFRVGN